MQFWRTIFKNCRDIILPLTCVWCGLPSNTDICLCQHCQLHLPKPTFSCSRCALPLDTAIEIENACGRCLSAKLYFTKIIAPFAYTSPINGFISNLKFHKQLHMARLLGNLLAVYLQENLPVNNNLPEIIIPVPLHKKRYQERGFNQALEIAKPIAKRLGIPLQPNLVMRSKNTQAQSQLGVKERQMNIKNAFVLPRKIAATYVALIDDVVTTHNTVNELSRILTQAGVARIDIWALSRVATGVNIETQPI